MLRSCHAGVSAEGGSLSSSLAALSHPFKLRLSRQAGTNSSLRDYSGNVVLIEPLATIGAIVEFLWPRVHRSAEEIATEESAAARRAQVALHTFLARSLRFWFVECGL